MQQARTACRRPARLTMSFAVFSASALIWAFLCVLVAIVAGAAAGSRTGYWKRALIGLLVGAVFGIIIITGALVSFVGALSFLLASLLPAPVARFSLYITGALLSVTAAAIVGLAVGLLEARSAPIVRCCVVVGVVFGLVLGIANAVLGYTLPIVLPAIESAGLGPFSAFTIGLVSIIQGVAVDVALAVIAFRLVRRRWGGAPPATATGTC